jgi:hypothetical protein
MSIGVSSLVPNRHTFSGLRRFQDCHGYSQRTNPIFPRGERFSLPKHCRIKMADLVCIKTLVGAEIDFFPFFLSLQKQPSLGLLGHHILANDGSFTSMDLEAGAGIFDRKCVMKLRQEAAPETDSSHYGVLETALSQTLLP